MIAHTAYAASDDRSVLIKTNSGKQMEILCTPKEYLAGLTAYKSGKMIQDAFFFLSNSEREFLISGLNPSDWAKMFPEGDDD